MPDRPQRGSPSSTGAAPQVIGRRPRLAPSLDISRLATRARAHASDRRRQLGISEATFYVLRKRFGKLGVAEERPVPQLEYEAARCRGSCRIRGGVGCLSLETALRATTAGWHACRQPAVGQHLDDWCSRSYARRHSHVSTAAIATNG